MRTKKIGLALGGGGARGLAHIGVIKVLFENSIKPDLIVGTSIGAIIGALLAHFGDTDAVVKRVQDYFDCDCFKKIQFDLFTDDNNRPKNDGLFDALSYFIRKEIFFNISLARNQSYVSLGDYLDNINFLIDDINIEDTLIPMAIVCTDVQAGEITVLTSGSMRMAVAASSAIPGIFPPIEFEGRLLLDGGWVDQLPAGPCRQLGADLVLAVDVAKELEQEYSLETGLDVIRRTNSITRSTLTRLQSKEADILITPDVGKLSWVRFDCIESCIKLGEEAARKALPAIKRELAKQEPSMISRIIGSTQ